MSAQTLLNEGLAQMRPTLPQDAPQKLADYLALLVKWNSTYNLTALREAEKMVPHHILDSLSLLPFTDGAKTLIDVGTGGGMPGIMLAVARPDLAVTLLDANSKKTAFLQQAVIELDLPNAAVVTGRVETLGKAEFDIVTSRAFAELGDFVRVTRQLLAENGCWAAMKGVYPYEEIAQLPADVQAASVHAVDVPQLDAQRHIVIMTRKVQAAS